MKFLLLTLVSLFSYQVFSVGMERFNCSDPSGHIQIEGLGYYPKVRLSKIEDSQLLYETFEMGSVKVLYTSQKRDILIVEDKQCDHLGRGMAWYEESYFIDVRIYKKNKHSYATDFSHNFIKQTTVAKGKFGSLRVVEGTVECHRVFETPLFYGCDER
jgi:hypothetical protein